jgi:hypothetical protein
MDASGRDVRVMRVAKGLFILRYVSSDAEGVPPRVVVKPSLGAEIELITEDFSAAGVMSVPGEALVVRASEVGSLDVTVGDSSTAQRHAHLVFERLTSTPSLAAQPEAPFQQQDLAGVEPSIEILAHVARRGDVVVAGGEWVSGPQFPLAIEGLEVVWRNRPADVDLTIEAVNTVRGRRQALGTAQSGKFIGTRGMAAPLTSLSLALTGPQAALHSLQCEALFLGAQVQRRSGANITLSGPSGLEPLVGLCLSIVSVAPASVEKPAWVRSFVAPQRGQKGPKKPSVAIDPPAVQTVGSFGRVRVLRKSRTQQSSPIETTVIEERI